MIGLCYFTLFLSVLIFFTQEEYNLIKPPKADEVAKMATNMKTFLFKHGVCGRCTTWQMEAGEVTGDATTERLDVGDWEPVIGVIPKDHLFPHVTGGLRGRRITVASINVR